MNKILTDTCQCGCNPTLPENLLKITSGNDFSIKLQLTEKIDDNWVHYDMTDMSNVTVSVVSPNNTATELDYIIDVAGNIQAIVDAQKFQSYIIYGIEVLWTDATDIVPVDKRAYAPNVFAFVNSSMEATDSSYEYTSDNPYEYNISMSNDVVFLSIGHIPEFDPSDYYTKDEIDSTLDNYATDQDVADAISTIDLSNYVTNSSLETTLQDYETKSELNTTLKDYAQLSDLSNYVTNSSLTTTLQDYVTDSELTTTLNPYATKQYVDDAVDDIDLSDYVTTTSLNNTLNDYVTDSELTTTLNPYATKQYVDTEINTSLNPYATKQYVDDAIDDIDIDTSNFYTKTEIDTTLEDYALYDDIDNYNNTISTALIEHQRSILGINSNFDNYYNKTASDARYVTASQVASQYVNNSSLDNVTQTTAASLNDLNSRVTTLEQGGGGGGTSYGVSFEDWENTNEAVAQAIAELSYSSVDLSNYYTKTEIDTTLNDYVTNTSLSSTLNDYVTNTSLSSTLSDYATIASVSDVVRSSTISYIVRISQQDYDNLSQVDQNTMYIII